MLPVFWEARELSFRGAHTLPLELALGRLCGVAAVSFTKLLYRVEDFARQVLPRWWVRALVAGLLVGYCGLWPPLRPLYGVGYDAVKPVFEGRRIGGEPLGLRLLLALFVLKYLTTSVTLAGGGSGGFSRRRRSWGACWAERSACWPPGCSRIGASSRARFAWPACRPWWPARATDRSAPC